MGTEALRHLMVVNILILLVGSDIAHESGPKTAPNAMNAYDEFEVP
jgi:hypothetical protein